MIREATESRISRREYLAAGTVGVFAGVSGCLDFIRDETLEFSASPSRVSQDALDATGYELKEQSTMEHEQVFEAGGESRDVIVTNVLTEYHKAIDLGPAGEAEGAFFSSLTTPQVEVLGREFNPVAEMSAEELAEMVQDQYEGIENLRTVEETEISIQGNETTQTKFRADAAFEGSPVELFLHVSEAVEMIDDFVVTVGAYPELIPDEEENILGMMRAVEPDPKGEPTPESDSEE